MAVGDSSEESDHDRERERKSKKRKEAGILPTAGFLLSAQKDGLPTKGDEFNDFFWDLLVKYACSAMVALTLLDILSSIRGDSVQCMTPSNFTRDQGAFVNNYCTQYTPPTDFFAFYLVAQATLIFGVHFLWYSWFSGKFCYFLALATSLERHRESKTGDNSLENFVIAKALLKSFGCSKSIYRWYIVKLVAQFLVSGFSIWFNFDSNIFGNYDPSFICPDNSTEIPTTWPIGSYRIPCVLTSLVLLVAVRWLNVILLCGIVLAVLYGFIWCLWDHKSRLNWAMVARFSFYSGLPPSSYVPKGFRQRYGCTSYFYKYRIRTDFEFLFLKLFREDAGHAKVLREVLIDDIIRREEKIHLERLSLWRQISDPSIVTELKLKIDQQPKSEKARNVVKKFPPGKRASEGEDLGDSLQCVLCNVLTAEVLGLDRVNALDISFGTNGFKIQLAANSLKVVGVDFNPYFLDKDEDGCVKLSVKEYANNLTSIRTLADIFSEDEKNIKEFKKEVKRVCREKSGSDSFGHANVIVVGPIPADNTNSGKSSVSRGKHLKGSRSRTTAVKWLLEWMRRKELLDPNSYLVTVRPVTVEGSGSISKKYVDFIPNWIPHVSPISVFGSSKEGKPVNIYHKFDNSKRSRRPQPVEMRCGSSHCDYNIMVYQIPRVQASGVGRVSSV